MDSIHIDMNQGIIRFFAEGKSHENEDPFLCSMQILKLSSEIVYAYNFWGTPTREYYKKLYKSLKEMGFKKIIAYMPTKWVAKGFMELPQTDLHIMEL